MSDGDKIALEIVDVVSRYCESQMINPTDVHIQLAADKEGKLHIVCFEASISVASSEDARSANSGYGGRVGLGPRPDKRVIMNTCESCKFWNRDASSDYRVAIEINDDNTRGLCMLHSCTEEKTLKELGYDPEYIHSRGLAEACSISESIGADFFTEPNFGCVQHAVKEGQ